MKIDLNKNLTDLEGKEVENVNIGKIVANAIAASGEGDPIKYMYWAKKLYEGEELELDPVDLENFKTFVLNNKGFTNLLKIQVLESIKNPS